MLATSYEPANRPFALLDPRHAEGRLEPVFCVAVWPLAIDDDEFAMLDGTWTLHIHRVTIPVPRTIADGQQTTSPGELNFPIIQRLVDDVVTVTDEEIVAAMVLAFERMKVVLEPSGASALAAVLSGRVPGVAGKRVGVTLSGGNVRRGPVRRASRRLEPDGRSAAPRGGADAPCRGGAPVRRRARVSTAHRG